MLALHVFFLWSIRGRIARGDPDFTVYYTAGKMLREGRGAQLYDPQAELEVQREFTSDSDIRRGPLPYIHPPFEAIFFLPLTCLQYATAFVVWDIVNLGMLAGALWVLRRLLVGLRHIPLLDCLLAVLALFPIVANFHQGQDAILLLLVLVLSFRSLERDADFAAGCWLGLGVFKFQFVVPVALLLILWRGLSWKGGSWTGGSWTGKKLALGFTAVASAAVLLSIALVGWPAALRYPEYSWRIVSSVRLGGLPFRLMPNLVGLVNGWPVLEDVGWLRWLAVAGSVALLVMAARMKARVHGQLHLRLACAVIAAVTISYNTNTYDLALLILPLALVVNYGLSAPDPAQTLRRLLLPASPLLVSPLWFFLWIYWARTNLMAIFLLWWFYAIWRESQRIATAAASDAELRVRC